MDATVIGQTAPEPSASPSRPRWSWPAAAASSLLLVAFAVHFSPASAPPVPPAKGLTAEGGVVSMAPEAPQWRFVKVAAVGQAAEGWTDPIPARIAIDETRASKLGSPLAGHVSRVFVELGQHVTEGDPLFSVHGPDIAEMRSSLARARVDLGAARATLERVRALVASRALPAKEEVSAEQQFEQAELGQRLAEAKLASLHIESEGENQFTVPSPRSGVVVEKDVLVGQQVTPDGNAALFVVADLASVWLVADLFEGQAEDVHEGTRAQITSPATPELALEGKVEMVSSVVDPARHTVPVRVRLDNPQGLLRPNVYARVRFATRTRSHDSVEVPASALLSDGERQFVYVQEAEGRFAKRKVVTGSSHEGRVAVLQGLAKGDKVVEEGAILLDNQVALSE
jgi:membrane fusion protein, heavy metal efflux system